MMVFLMTAVKGYILSPLYCSIISSGCAGKSLYLSALHLRNACLSLAPTQYRLCIVLMEWPELHLIFHIIHLFEAAKYS